jgi:hypothetical protein
VTDPDKRNIATQRFSDDAVLRYLVGEQQPHAHTQLLEFFGEQYAGRYRVFVPTAPGGQWKAVALFGQHDELSGWSPSELLEEVTHHQCSNDRKSEDDK